MAHYYIERGDLYGIAAALGIDALGLMSFTIAKAWHIDLGVVDRSHVGRGCVRVLRRRAYRSHARLDASAFALERRESRHVGGVARDGLRHHRITIASGVWNFIGAGVPDFFINLSTVNYDEHGTFLIVAHAHAAMFGAFGFLALGMGTYVLRFTTQPEKWDPTNLKRAFWLWNLGLAWMVVVGDIPIGFLQLQEAFINGYDAARSLSFCNSGLIQTLFWVRLRRCASHHRRGNLLV